MKILALHLPAFHEIDENNIWWGEGFTEWDNVKKGKPLFKGHVQPLIPFENNYYDLSELKTLKAQFDLANKFGLSGFIFYHYWFNGHKLFEKPIENLLNDPTIDGSFCLCWANETWSRTWEGKNSEVLIKQEYGNLKDWDNHIEYLFKFFSDKRYIKLDGRPLLFIYSCNQIPEIDKKINLRNKYLEKKGMKPIYLVEFLRAKNNMPASKLSEGVIEFEPMYTIRYDLNFFEKAKRYLCKKLKLIDFQDYDKVWMKILKRKRVYNKKLFKSCFTAWDNSPRKGKKNSIILKNSSPEKFGMYFKKLLSSNRKNASNDLIIINAWNEWGEGAILEPSSQYGFSYLENLKKAIDDFE